MIDANSIVAFDVHTHAEVSDRGQAEGLDTRQQRELAAQQFKSVHSGVTPTQTAQFYREQKMACVIFPVDTETARGDVMAVSNEEVAEAAAKNSDVLVPFGSIDPWKGARAVRDVRRLVEGHGIRGFKFHPSLQEFYPNDRKMYPLFQAISDAGVPAIFHTGQTGMGKGTPGGSGVRLKYSHPMHIDDLAADFPELKMIMAHPSVPWQDEALAVALHKGQVHIDLSGWSPRYFPENLVRYANTLLKDKVLFGTDYPLLTPERWMRDFEKASFKDEVRQGILKDNALRLLGLAQ